MQFIFPFFYHFTTISATIGNANPRESLWETLHQQKAQITRDCFIHPRNSFALSFDTLRSLLLVVVLLWRSFDITRNSTLPCVSLITITFLITIYWQFPASSALHDALSHCTFNCLFSHIVPRISIRFTIKTLPSQWNVFSNTFNKNC